MFGLVVLAVIFYVIVKVFWPEERQHSWTDAQIVEQQRIWRIEEAHQRVLYNNRGQGIWTVHARQVVNEQLSRPKYRNRLIVQKVTKNLDLINDLRRAFLLQDLVEYPRTPYIVTSVSPFSSEFQLVLSKFEMKNKLIFRVRQILKVENTFLMLQYQLMARNWRYACAQECLLFHGTKEENLNGICRNNFDRSKIVNSKFGRGVSFARDAFYASHYHHDNKRNPDKVMVLTKVLFGELDFGYKDMVVPRAPSYTSKNLEGSVVVKYDDASFYPAYIIRYSGMHSNKTLRKCC